MVVGRRSIIPWSVRREGLCYRRVLRFCGITAKLEMGRGWSENLRYPKNISYATETIIYNI